MFTMLLMPSVALVPGIRYGVQVILVLANICMPSVRFLLRGRVIRLDDFIAPILHNDIQVEGLIGNGAAFVTSTSVENVCQRETEAMKSRSITNTTSADSAPASSTPLVFAAHAFNPSCSR